MTHPISTHVSGWEPQLGSRRFGQVASGATLGEEDHGNHGTGKNMVQQKSENWMMERESIVNLDVCW